MLVVLVSVQLLSLHAFCNSGILPLRSALPLFYRQVWVVNVK